MVPLKIVHEQPTIVQLSKPNLPTKIGMADWSDDDKPREKLIAKGARALSDVELLTILIATGTRSRSAYDLAMELYTLFDNNIGLMAQSSIGQLMQVNGIGKAKAITIKAAMELAYRSKFSNDIPTEPLTTSNAIYNLCTSIFRGLLHEEFWVLALNKRRKLIAKKLISTGTKNHVLIDVKDVVLFLSDVSASAYICLHNHPSGALEPSNADNEITYKLEGIGKALSIPLLDHLIYADVGYFSYHDSERLG